MTASLTLFANNTAPTGPELDNNFLAYAVFCNIPCTLSGSNAITLAQNANTPTLTQITNYIQFTGIIATTNTGAVTVTHPSFGTLNGYKDSPAGPAALVGGELIAGNMATFRYDSALNTGSGGYHIYTNTGFAGGTITSNLVASGASFIASGGSVGATLSSALLTGNSLTASITSLAVGPTNNPVLRIVSALASVTFTALTPNNTQDQLFAVPGAQIRDSCHLGMGSNTPTGAGFFGFFGTIGTVTIRMINPAAAATIAATTLTIRATGMGFT